MPFWFQWRCHDKFSPGNSPLISSLFLRLEQTLHKQQEQHSRHADNIFSEKGAAKYLKMPFYVLGSIQQQKKNNNVHGVCLSEGSPVCLFITQAERFIKKCVNWLDKAR